jgi:uncharacterized protein with von Willebrand factor type A (vWA) domain
MRLKPWLALALFPAAALAAPPDDTRAFDRAFAASFYTFDACGDAKYGVIFRDALDARLAQCAFSDAARETHRRRSYWQAKKSHELMNKLIETTGGVPNRLPGMDETCRQRQAEPDYIAVRAKLERYSEGALKPEDLLPTPCDAEAVAP